MKKFIVAALFALGALAPSTSYAQCGGQFPAFTACGNDSATTDIAKKLTAPRARNAIGAQKTYNVVTDCGAKGDGTTADQSAINTCISSAVSAGGGTIYLPPPAVCYKITASIVATSTVPISIIGNGADTTSICPTGAAIKALDLTFTGADSKSVYLRGFTVKGPVGATNGSGSIGINLTQGNGGLIEQVTIGEYDAGLPHFDRGLVTAQSASLTVRGSKFIKAHQWAIYAVADTTADNMDIDGNIFYANGVPGTGGAIQLGITTPGGVANSIKIRNNDFALNYTGLLLKDLASSIISGNYFEVPINSLITFACGLGNSLSTTLYGNHLNGHDGAAATSSTFACLDKLEAFSNYLLSWNVTCAITCGQNVDFHDGRNSMFNSTIVGFNKRVATTPTVTPIGGPGAFAATATLRVWYGVGIKLQYVVTITNVGTATGWSVPVPTAPAAGTGLTTIPLAAAGIKLTCFGANSAVMGTLWNGGSTGTDLQYYKYDGTTAPSAETFTCNGEYERG